ncbi:MAG: FAD-binding oxidoreductase [bacterium]
MEPVLHPVKPYAELPDTIPVRIVQSPEKITDRYSDYLVDESRFSGGHADELVFAHTEKQVVDTLKRAYTSEIPVTVSAGRTGIVGGAVPQGGILLSLESMNHFLGARWYEERKCWCVQVEPGLTIKDLKDILDKKKFEEPLSVLKGDPKKQLEKFSQESDHWFYPPDPTEQSAHLGGTVALNSSGARSFKYGQTRMFVTGLRVALTDGTLLDIQRGATLSTPDKGFVIQIENDQIVVPVPSYQSPEVKNAAGYFVRHPMDFVDFFIGSEGTLGVITAIELALVPKPEFILRYVAFFHSEDDALCFVHSIKKRSGIQSDTIAPAALEYFDAYSLDLLRQKRAGEGSGSAIPDFPAYARAAIYLEQEGRNEDLEAYCSEYIEILSECNASGEDAWGAIDEAEMEKINKFRHAVPEQINAIIAERKRTCPEIHKIGTDFSVPDDALVPILQIYRSHLNKEHFEYAIFGHIGDNHLHVNVLPGDTEELNKAKALYMEFARKAVSYGGTVSGEHGIGKIKRALLPIMYSQKTIGQMKQVKKRLDPKNLLGPGILF